MEFVKNMSVGKKIIAAIIAVLLLELCLSGAAFFFVSDLNTEITTLADVQARKMKFAARVNRNLVEMQRAEKNMLLAPTGKDLDLFRNNYRTYRAELEDNLGQLGKLVEHPDEGMALRRFVADYEAFITVHSQVESLILGIAGDGTPAGQGKAVPDISINSRAVALSIGHGREVADSSIASMKDLVTLAEHDLEEAKQTSAGVVHNALLVLSVVSLASIVIGLFLGIMIARSIAGTMNTLVGVADAIAAGKLDTDVEVTSRDETGQLAEAISRMQVSLRQAAQTATEQDWLKSGLVRINNAMRGELDAATLSTKVITELATYLDAPVGALYLAEENSTSGDLVLTASYAYTRRKNLSNRYKSGESLVGQAALEGKQILVTNVPDDYIKVTSGLGEASPRNITVTPALFEDRVKAVIEIGTLEGMTEHQLDYLNQAMATLAINLETARARERLAEALAASQALTEELQTQQEELKSANEELEEQTQMLTASEEKLKAQQEELQVSNEELEEKNESLVRQKREIEQARETLAVKAQELAIASKYKSEFLANMSHELRTPLNSLLILSKTLADNREGNLSEDQVESAGIIHSSGNDLLGLINEILDLAKIEAGRMDVQAAPVTLVELVDTIRGNFQHMANDKGLTLDVAVADDAPQQIQVDRKRLEQILKNLLANALKFTEKGGVAVTFGRPKATTDLSKSGLNARDSLAIQVRDTGIGIAADVQQRIFEAFQQADGGTARRYGGTGLGLTISRELAHLLGGEIQLQSEEGMGSVFTVYLSESGAVPRVQAASAATPLPPVVAGRSAAATALQLSAAKDSPPEGIADDRLTLGEDDKCILVIEDDLNFARLLLKKCHERGFKCLAAPTGEQGLILAVEKLPGGIVLDIRLPGMDGWAVLEELKNNPMTRHIPVHIMSVEEPNIEALAKGAIGHLTKPVTREALDQAFVRLETTFSKQIKELLLVEDDENLRKSIIKLVGTADSNIVEAGSGQETIEALKAQRYDCMILDLGLPDMTGFELLERLEQMPEMVVPPVIVYTGMELSREQEAKLRKHAESIIIKSVRSEERLLDEVSLFLHRVVATMPEQKRRMITNLYEADAMFADKKILVVDDDMRNVFALSKILEEKGMRVTKAENGKKAIEILIREPAMDLVLMDIMMPVMDGYETMRQIRARQEFARLPIIALTAKAMKEDRDKCIKAGANDYLAKPVDADRLFSMMRVWLYR